MTEIIPGTFRGSLNSDLPLEESDIVGSYASTKAVKLQKRLGYSHGFALMVGLILGSGVFISPGLVAKDTSSAGMLLMIWVFAGIIALLGALCYCELGCIFKMAGGNYANIFNIYGDAPAFLCAWTTCLVIDPSSIATIALTIGTYLAKPFYNTDQDGEITAKTIAFCVILCSCVLNCISINLSNVVQRVLAIAQITSVLFVVTVGIWQLSKGKTENFNHGFNNTQFNSDSPLHIGIALFGGLWSYDGWAQMSNVIEEMENLDRNLFLTVVTGIPFVILCYIMTNISFLTLLSHSEMASSEAVGVVFMERALGVKVSYLMMVLVALASYATLNGTFFAIPRLTMSAAREGHMPTVFSFLHKKNGLPIPATLLLTLISCLMLIPKSSNLNTLMLLFSQAQWMIYTSSIFGVILLRIRQPNLPRPFKIFIGVPIFVTLVGLYLIIIPFFRNIWLSCILFGYILLGIPVYFIFVRYSYTLPACCLNFASVSAMKIQKYCNMVPCTKNDL